MSLSNHCRIFLYRLSQSDLYSFVHPPPHHAHTLSIAKRSYCSKVTCIVKGHAHENLTIAHKTKEVISIFFLKQIYQSFQNCGYSKIKTFFILSINIVIFFCIQFFYIDFRFKKNEIKKFFLLSFFTIHLVKMKNLVKGKRFCIPYYGKNEDSLFASN